LLRLLRFASFVAQSPSFDQAIRCRKGSCFVSGDLKLSGGYMMDNNDKLSVLQAVALALGG